MQPVVGAIADRSTSKYGRRRPFMVGGSIMTSLCLLLLGWTQEVVGVFTGHIERKSTVVIVVAVLSIYVLDFAINAVQACCRSIIVDVLPISQQQTGSAWAARMAASGHVIGFLIGTLDLVHILPNWLGGDTQFKKMCLVASVGLWLAVGLTCWAVHERQLLRPPQDSSTQSGFGVLKSLWKRMWNLPPRIQLICWCQFWGWIGWFPFLFYSSTWVGETYYRYEHPAVATSSTTATPTRAEGSGTGGDTLGNIGRLGSLSLVLFSIVTLLSSVILPHLVEKPEDAYDPKSSRPRFTPRPPPSLGKEIQKVLMRIYESPKPNLVTTWGLSNLAFAAIMVWAPFVRSLRFATTLVALCGVPWAVSCWAPFAEMGVEINRLASGGSTTGVLGAGGTLHGYRAVEGDDVEEDVELQNVASDGQRQGPGHRITSSGSTGILQLNHDEEDGDSTGELAGVYLGVLNVYTTLPQFVGTFISWIVFSLLEPKSTGSAADGTEGNENAGGSESTLGKKLDGVNSIAVCLFVGALCAVIAAEATRRLKKMTPGLS